MNPINKHVEKIAQELYLTIDQVKAVATLLSEEATIPFIARYRKEATDSLDEVEITAIRDRLEQLAELDKRRDAILKSLKERDLLTDELKTKIEQATTLTTLEDIYLPFRPKRRTRATIAKEKGLEPLAKLIFENQETTPEIDPLKEAEKFINKEKEVETADDALSGARDIIAEQINENQKTRELLRELFINQSTIKSKQGRKGKEDTNKESKFKDYYDWQEDAKKAPSHRILAMMRGEKESFLTLDILPDEEDALQIIGDQFLKGNTQATNQVKLAVEDSYKRLLIFSMEMETRVELKRKADEEAIKIFGNNLQELLLTAPLGQKNILSLDPGFRTGCKLVCLDKQGKLLHNETIYPHSDTNQMLVAQKTVIDLCKKFDIEAIAIGNGTASRETENFIRKSSLPKQIPIVMVNESGASIYSASEIARSEFPNHDITVRGAVSIGRRLADPLAELVKIDPKSIGVGQYQHDVNQKLLQKNLDNIVISCVNNVGVNVNTASEHLLNYVSGLSPRITKNIIKYRDENGPFADREELKKVTFLGDKAFEQSAGFLRISNSKNPLDNSAVHPESYHIVDNISKDINIPIDELLNNDKFHHKINLENYISDTVGLPTLEDILNELAKPGRDPREKFEAFNFASGVEDIKDLKVGMKLPGIVTNTTAFGAFIDIGVHQDGLVHISHIADKFVKDPCEILKVQQKVEATVLEVDVTRKRISLSLKKNPFENFNSNQTNTTQTPGTQINIKKTNTKKSPSDNLPASYIEALQKIKSQIK